MQQNTIQFLENIAQNNNKPWFDEHRKEYEAAKKDFELFVGEVLKELSVPEPAFGEQKAKDCVFRIFRDVRFSHDKTPYKSNFGAGFSRGGKNFPGAGYYIHIEPGKSFAGGGIWNPEAPLLKAIRQEIDYSFTEFNDIIGNKDFLKTFGKLDGEKLKTVPKGYDQDNQAIEYLKMKSFTVHHQLDEKSLTGNNLVKDCMHIFAIMKPFVDFLNKSID
jgi:uncharacterized protein (TIGR02453 family)